MRPASAADTSCSCHSSGCLCFCFVLLLQRRLGLFHLSNRRGGLLRGKSIGLNSEV